MKILLPHIIYSASDWFYVLNYVWTHAEMARTSASCMALKNADSFGSVGISEPRSCYEYLAQQGAVAANDFGNYIWQ